MEKIVHLTDLGNLPLSSNQKRLWIISQQNKSDPGYNIQLAYHLEGEINVEVFKESIRLLFERQHSLFSVFKKRDGIPYISIIPRPVFVELIDFSCLPLQSCREEIISFAGKQSRIPFDIGKGPLYRLYLLKMTAQSYFFCFTIHHLIFDGFSRRLFVQELSRIYSNLILGINETGEPLKFQSYDFAVPQKETLSQANEKNLIEYWKENLKACPPDIKFPYDFPRSNNPTGLGCREPFQISREYSQKLRTLSQESDTSVFNALLSTLGILFNKSTGINDICIGIPVSNRRSIHSFKVFGFFVDTLPVRFVINEEENFRKYINYSTEVFKKAVQNSLPFDKIVEALKPERITGLNPFFQICFSWINNFTIPMNLGGIAGKRITVPNGVASFDITFSMWENGDFIEGEIEYNIDIIKRETIIRLRDNFLVLIKNLLENPDNAIGSLPMISEEERVMIDAINDTRTEYPKDKTLVQLFEEQVLENPDKSAIVFHNESLTYDQLDRRSNQLARTLREKCDIRRDTSIGILVDKSHDLIIGILGILKSGGAYLPIDPEYPLQRINLILKDAGCRILLTQGKYMNLAVKDVVKFDLNSPDSYNHEESRLETINSSSDLAYFMYTSGTTGGPKGSMIRQQSVVRLVRNTNYIEFTEKDRTLLTGAIVFDASTFEIWGTLLNGGCLYIVEKETILDPKTLGEELIGNEITILWLTSALFTYLAESRTDIFGKLKYLLVGGDVLSAIHINKVRKDNPRLKVINGYGPTENTTFSTCFEIDRDYDHNIPIGKPISNSTAYIFDKNLNYQPIGVIGELYVGGDGVSRGYLNRDNLNKLSFVQHPYIPGERLYKTGDYARWLPDGNIEFLGRIDNQVKIRGFRIEVEEIEAVLSEIEGIIEAVVKPIKIDANDIRLVAFLNVPVGFSIDFNEVSNRIMGKLPPYMVPSAYKTVHGFPMTLNGKTDRKALTIDLSELKEEGKTGEFKELTSTQQKLLKIWQDILKTNSIGINDNFFYVGGNSLLSLLVIDRIEKELNVSLDLRVFFDAPIIQSISEIIDIKTNSTLTPEGIDNQQKIRKGDKIIEGEL